MGFNTNMLRDNRYEGIIHLITSADGADEYYNVLTNEARYESRDEAVEKDRALRKAYYLHKNWWCVDNNVPDFTTKMMRAMDACYNIIGLRRAIGTFFYKKFLLKKITQDKKGLLSGHKIPIDYTNLPDFEEFEVFEDFIDFKTNEGTVTESSITRKGKGEAFSYTHEYTIIKKNQRIRKKRNISAAEYLHLLERKIADMQQVHKHRLAVVMDTIYYIIDYYDNVPGQPVLMIVQLINKMQEISETKDRLKLPKGIEISRDVTDEQAYFAH